MLTSPEAVLIRAVPRCALRMFTSPEAVSTVMSPPTSSTWTSPLAYLPANVPPTCWAPQVAGGALGAQVPVDPASRTSPLAVPTVASPLTCSARTSPEAAVDLDARRRGRGTVTSAEADLAVDGAVQRARCTLIADRRRRAAASRSGWG